jgi:hypothetical protein
MYGLLKSHRNEEARHHHHHHQQQRRPTSSSRKPRSKKEEDETKNDKEQRQLQETVDAMLKEHHQAVTLPRKHASLLRRDSYSTFTTAPETPESSVFFSKASFISPTPSKNKNGGDSLPLVICFIRQQEQQQESSMMIFPQETPLIQKARKFLPDSMNVGDFYGDDDEEIVFLPDNNHNNNDTVTATSSDIGVVTSKTRTTPPPPTRCGGAAASIARRTSRDRPTLRRGTSGGLDECVLPPIRSSNDRGGRPSFRLTRIEI